MNPSVLIATGFAFTLSNFLMPTKKPLRWYWLLVIAWMAPMGVQSVLFPYLVAVELNQPPEMVGLALTASQLPNLMLVLLGGLIADNFSRRKILIILHCIASLMPMAVLLVIQQYQLAYWMLIIWGISSGTLTAFALPARDALLSELAAGDLQKAITIAMAVNFSSQLIGISIASTTQDLGLSVILWLQMSLFALGVIAAIKLPKQKTNHSQNSLSLSALRDGAKVVYQSTIMWPALVLNMAVGLLFIGTFVVLIPLTVRDIYAGASGQISIALASFMIGTIFSTIMLVRFGGIQRQGRGLMCALFTGGFLMLPMTVELPFAGFLSLLFCWGMGGGVAMSMGRTIMQQAAPSEFRARVLAMFNLAQMGFAPVGSAAMGYLAAYVGVLNAYYFPGILMLIIVVVVATSTTLWQVTTEQLTAAAQG